MTNLLTLFCTCWFELVRLFQNCGVIDKLDYLFHKTGPQAGQPRGYAFVTFFKREDAVRARREFDGKVLLGRTLYVKTARSVSKVNDLNISYLFLTKDICFFPG